MAKRKLRSIDPRLARQLERAELARQAFERAYARLQRAARACEKHRRTIRNANRAAKRIEDEMTAEAEAPKPRGRVPVFGMVAPEPAYGEEGPDNGVPVGS